MSVVNLLASIPAALPDELFEDLLSGERFRVERIVSRGHHSPDDFWYDQMEHEWVLVLSGEARLELEGQPTLLSLSAGMSVNIPAHCRHRVAWTHPEQDTVWLAIFYTNDRST